MLTLEKLGSVLPFLICRRVCVRRYSDLQTLFFTKPFELCTYYPHSKEEAEAQREKK